jgi:hypothetical protein
LATAQSRWIEKWPRGLAANARAEIAAGRTARYKTVGQKDRIGKLFAKNFK